MYEEESVSLFRDMDKNRLKQVHLDFIEHLKPILHATPDSLKDTFIEYSRCIESFGTKRKLLRVYVSLQNFYVLFHQWIIYAKRGRYLREISQLMDVVNQKIEGAMITQKNAGNFHQH